MSCSPQMGQSYTVVAERYIYEITLQFKLHEPKLCSLYKPHDIATLLIQLDFFRQVGLD